jgi:hypothetical protein
MMTENSDNYETAAEATEISPRKILKLKYGWE